MAELEVVKHAKKVMDTVGDREKGWKHKLKDIILEILIIVFAVSLSISLHNWSERNHDRHEEEEFLHGLKLDLQSDLKEMSSDSANYSLALKGIKYFLRVSDGEALNKDSMNIYYFLFYNTTYLVPNSGRFEGLKASGKLGVLENKELRNDILDFYQEFVPMVNLNNDWINTYKSNYVGSYVNKNLDLRNGKDNWEQVLGSNEMRNGLTRMLDIEEIVGNYGAALAKVRQIINLIDKEVH
ncbi:MAG: hypothetical protein DI535_17445 [Citrobacter freundii]|nr:MAG: hypothetical protein DI535_17445 [Citrobacter freundii]